MVKIWQILQIITAPEGLLYKRKSGGKASMIVDCLALVEEEDGRQKVVPMAWGGEEFLVINGRVFDVFHRPM